MLPRPNILERSGNCFMDPGFPRSTVLKASVEVGLPIIEELDAAS